MQGFRESSASRRRMIAAALLEEREREDDLCEEVGVTYQKTASYLSGIALQTRCKLASSCTPAFARPRLFAWSTSTIVWRMVDCVDDSRCTRVFIDIGAESKDRAIVGGNV